MVTVGHKPKEDKLIATKYINNLVYYWIIKLHGFESRCIVYGAMYTEEGKRVTKNRCYVSLDYSTGNIRRAVN